ncbi:MAG: hypothetical protein IIC78_05735 [Chloroflexi bacterium]|nr:hypothetical protein [Chloroflexota bacterium]
MLPIFVISAAIAFFVVWKAGLLDELRKWSLQQQTGQRGELTDEPMDEEMSKRLEIFEEFIDEMPDEDDPS